MLTRQGDEIYGENWQSARSDIVPVDVTPAEKWLDTTDGIMSLTEDMGPVRPPWPQTWVEYVSQMDDGLKRVGASVVTPETDDIEVFFPDGAWSALKNKGASIRKEEKDEYVPVISTWYWEDKKERLIPLGMTLNLLDSRGEAVTSVGLFKPSEVVVKTLGLEEVGDIHPYFRPVWFGFALCHASNVNVFQDKVPDPVQKKRRKSGKNPGKTFKCLDIDPMKKQSRRESEEGESDVERALHICRGHFKTYTEENPLFGQHTGTYWWPMHVRGSEDAGEVEKSYSVNNPS